MELIAIVSDLAHSLRTAIRATDPFAPCGDRDLSRLIRFRDRLCVRLDRFDWSDPEHRMNVQRKERFTLAEMGPCLKRSSPRSGRSVENPEEGALRNHATQLNSRQKPRRCRLLLSSPKRIEEILKLLPGRTRLDH